MYAVYSAGRTPLAATVDLWSERLDRHLGRGAQVLDLGSGVGIWSELMAERFDARVVGVEPSARMREVAGREHAHPQVRYLEGSAERIPLPDSWCAVSTLELISDADFEEGLERLRLAAEREGEPRPAVEPANMLVFRRR
jgi:SAM-dependent methyltransferase